MGGKEPRLVEFLKSLAELYRCLGVDNLVFMSNSKQIKWVCIFEFEGGVRISIKYEWLGYGDIVSCVVRRDGSISYIDNEEAFRHYAELAMKDENIRNAVEILRMSCGEIKNLVKLMKEAHKPLKEVLKVASKIGYTGLVLPCGLTYMVMPKEIYARVPPSIRLTHRLTLTEVRIIHDPQNPNSGNVIINVKANNELRTEIRTTPPISRVRDISSDVKRAEEVLECIISNYSGGEEEIKRKVALAILYP